MLLFLIRHAVTPETGTTLTGWRRGVHLSPEGLRQASATADLMRPVPLEAIYSSPIDRALDTARVLASAKRLRVRSRAGLGEVRYGEWEGRRLRQLARSVSWRTVLAHPSETRFPGGETLRETQARALAAVAKIASAHPGGQVAVFSHADVIKLVVAHYAGVPIDLYFRLTIAPASVTVVALGEGPPRIVKLNETGSLEGVVPAQRPDRRRGVGKAATVGSPTKKGARP